MIASEEYFINFRPPKLQKFLIAPQWLKYQTIKPYVRATSMKNPKLWWKKSVSTLKELTEACNGSIIKPFYSRTYPPNLAFFAFDFVKTAIEAKIFNWHILKCWSTHSLVEALNYDLKHDLTWVQKRTWCPWIKNPCLLLQIGSRSDKGSKRRTFK